MTKEKLLKLETYKQKIELMIENSKDSQKHKHNLKEFLFFLNKELSTTKNKINLIKLEMTNK